MNRNLYTQILNFKNLLGLIGKGEEQKEVKKETFEREIRERLWIMTYGQRYMQDGQKEMREKLEIIDTNITDIEERQIEIIKMLMSIKERL